MKRCDVKAEIKTRNLYCFKMQCQLLNDIRNQIDFQYQSVLEAVSEGQYSNLPTSFEQKQTAKSKKIQDLFQDCC